jgi:hypothetical protein
MDDSAIDPNVAALLGMIAHVQRQYPDAFVRVSQSDGVISYIFISLPMQRKKGSLYGDLRLFDDKHGVSSSGYHLAACTVQTNAVIEPVAWAFFSSSNGANWSTFVNDCVDAFASTRCGPIRSWNVSIADGDGQIRSAVNGANAGVLLWRCYSTSNYEFVVIIYDSPMIGNHCTKHWTSWLGVIVRNCMMACSRKQIPKSTISRMMLYAKKSKNS